MANQGSRQGLSDGVLSVQIINDIPTTTYCRLSSSHDAGSNLILCVPGSPGMAHFYVPFVDHLYKLYGGTVDVCAVSHAGHSPGGKIIENNAKRDWYSLGDQVKHKVSFITSYYPNLQNLYLIGHSIGCHMILNMLDNLPEPPNRSILLFPAIERFSETPNARVQRHFYMTLRWLALLLMWISTLFPDSFRKFVLKLRFRKCPPAHVNDMINGVMSITRAGLYQILCMANNEMEVVQDLPVNVISRYHGRLVFYYGVNDQWNLPSFYDDLVSRFPSIDATLCSQGYEHAFVLKSSIEMAEYCFKKLS